jgi:amino acid transporter
MTPIANEHTTLLHSEEEPEQPEPEPETEEHYFIPESVAEHLPDFVVTSVDYMAEQVVTSVEDMAEQIGEFAVELTTFEPMEGHENEQEHKLLEGEENDENGTYDALDVSTHHGESPIHEQHSDDHSHLSHEHPHDPLAPFEGHEKLGVIPLAVMVFYSVSGGPFGCEASVRSGGNFYTLIAFLVMPFVWSMQEALMTAELGTAFPEASGGVAWVEEAFGVNAAWMSGYLGWMAGATDNAIYPVLFMDYLLQALHSDGSDVNPIARFLLLSGTSIALGYINWLGLPLVGKMSVSICFVAMSPFVILTLVGAFKIDPNRWFELPQEDPAKLDVTDDDTGGGIFPDASLGGVLWRPFLNNLFWNLNSFDAAASFAADIEDPGSVLPKAMAWSVLMVASCYFFPLLIAIGATDADQHEWVDGFLARVTGDVVGPWLGAWTVFAAGISNIALFQAELSADAFQLMGMADRGHVPKLFSQRSQHGTPTYGIMLGTAVIVVMGTSNLDTLIEMLNFNYAISLLMEYCAFIKLRISAPNLVRPYRIPLSTTGCIIMLTPTFIATFFVLGLATYQTYGFSLAVNAFGILIYQARQRSELMRMAMCQKEYGAVMVTEVEVESIDSTAPDGDSATASSSDITPPYRKVL